MHVNLPEKLYYTIGEVSKAFEVNTSLIRFWEKEFEVLKPKKNSKGTRRYSSIDIENFQTIHHLVKCNILFFSKKYINWNSVKIVNLPNFIF